MGNIRIGIGLDVSDLVANAERAKSSLESVNRALGSSVKDGNLEDIKAYTAASIQTRNQISNDARIGGYSDKVTLDTGPLLEQIKSIESLLEKRAAEGNAKEVEQYTSVLNRLRGQLASEQVIGGNSKLEDALRQAINSGDLSAVRSQFDLRKQFVQDARLGGDTELKLDSGPLEAVMRELKDAINRMISEGKTEEAKKYGSVLKDFQKQFDFEQGGGDEREKKLKEAQRLRLMRSLVQFTNAQNVIGSAGAGNIAGAALGAAGGIGELVSHIPKGALIGGAVVGGGAALAAGANKLSEQWEKVMQPSMALAASLGRLGDDAGKNHAVFQEVFARATDRRVLHGYKLEEGLELAGRLSKSGMAAGNVIGGEEQVFRYQRMTDADRGTLAQAVGLAGRYRGGENVLGYAYGGVKESGMQQGQYQEYLNATLRIFEEGLARGVVKGFAEITRTQNMLAMIGDTWKGEQGAEKYARMNDAVTGAYKLQSDYDVIMYQAARNLNGGKGDYIETAKRLDQGLTPELLGEYHKILEGSITAGDDRSGIMQYMNTFSLNATAAEQIYDYTKKGKWQEAIDKIEDPSSKAVDETPEGKLLSATEGIRGDLAQIGSNIVDAKAGVVDAISKLTGIMAGNRLFASSVVETMSVLSSVGVTGERQRKSDKAFEKAFTASDQPDLDNNGEGDYAQRAKTVLDDLKGLPTGAQYFTAMYPQNQVFQALDMFKSEKDFTEENTRQALSAIQLVNDVVSRQNPGDLRKSYFEGVASAIPQDNNTRKDDELRYLLTHYSDKIPDDPKIMSAIEAARDTTRPGSNGAEISNRGHFKEVDNILRTLETLVPEFKDVAKALRESNEWVIRQE